MLPVKKAFVKFDVDSLFSKSEDNSKLRDLKTLKTVPKESGASPNILSILTYSIINLIFFTYLLIF